MVDDLYLVQHISDITWGGKHYWYYIVLVFLLALLLLIYRIYKTHSFVGQLAEKWVHMLFSHFSMVRIIIKGLLLMVGVGGLCIALLQPQIIGESEKVVQEGRDVLFALDISRSMLASDLSPSRLEAAKKKINAMIPLFSCERVGLIVFSGSAIVQCPFTTDHSLFSLFVDGIDAQTISLGTTAIEQVLIAAMQLFGKIPERKSKILVLFTDGEDFSSDLLRVAKKAALEGVHLYIVGVASEEGAPVPIFDNYGKQIGYEHDAQGGVIISRLGEQALKQLATEVNGDYVRITGDMSDGQKIVEHIRGFDRERFDDMQLGQIHQLYRYPLIISFICFCIEWLL